MTTLADRYGAPSPLRRRLAVAGAVAVAIGFLGWLAWATWFHATPDVRSELVTWRVVGDHEATATVSVVVAEGEAASCVVRAVAADHTTVGEVAFEPESGSNQVSIRTERRATSVSLLGCTTEDQPRPR
jgi:hypothetical protein